MVLKAEGLSWEVMTPSGEVTNRFRTGVKPEDPSVVEAIEAQLPS